MNLRNGRLKGYLFLLFLILLWAVARPKFLPSIQSVIASLEELFCTKDLLYHIGISVYRAALGFFIALVIAIPLGVIISSFTPNLQKSFEPVIDLFSQANPLMIYHLVLIILGVGESPKILMIVWICIWPILFGTISGITKIDPTYINYAKSLAITKLLLVSKVLLPGAIPQIFQGVKMSFGYSLFILIAAEMMGGSSGLGYLVKFSQNIYRTEWVIGLVMVIAIIGIIMDEILYIIEKKSPLLSFRY